MRAIVSHLKKTIFPPEFALECYIRHLNKGVTMRAIFSNPAE